VFGRDYDAPDGTCIRDYIHTQDLCSAHWLALRSLLNGEDSQSYNLGNGNGFSVQEVIDTAEQVTGHKIPVANSSRRDGEPEEYFPAGLPKKKEIVWLLQDMSVMTDEFVEKHHNI
jgi:UDP-glucose 4-epimerase